MNKYIQYKDTKIMRGSQLYELLASGKPEDLKKAEALHKETTVAFNKNWDPQYNHLRNWNAGTDLSGSNKNT